MTRGQTTLAAGVRSALADALARAGLPGAGKVTVTRAKTPDGWAFSLTCHDPHGAVIGEDRDYEILRVHFARLEAALEAIIAAEGRAEEASLTATLEVAAGLLVLS